jgi:cysteine sulfinate desulfinase/cysteine desulfurase-like protein
MIPSELERLILERKAKGHIPFFVNATAGTTVLGAFDPIEPIADICQKYKLWLHVDVSIELSSFAARCNTHQLTNEGLRSHLEL